MSADAKEILNKMQKYGPGGQAFMFEGMVEGIQTKANDQNGEITASCRLAFFKGEKYIRFADPDDIRFLFDGCWATVKCDVLETNKGTYATNAVLITVEGKPVDRSGTGKTEKAA